MKGILVTISGVSKVPVDAVVKSFESVLTSEGMSFWVLNDKKQEKFEDIIEKGVRSGLVVLCPTNELDKILCKDDKFFTFNVDVVNSKEEDSESIMAIWRVCPTVYPRLVVNTDFKNVVVSDVKNAVSEIKKWVNIS